MRPGVSARGMLPSSGFRGKLQGIEPGFFFRVERLRAPSVIVAFYTEHEDKIVLTVNIFSSEMQF